MAPLTVVTLLLIPKAVVWLRVMALAILKGEFWTLLTSGVAPSNTSGLPAKFTAWLAKNNWLRVKLPKSLVLLMGAVLAKIMSVWVPPVGFPGGLGSQVTVLQLPATVFVKMGGTEGTALASMELVPSLPALTPETT